jgi:hypothetical protein
LVNSKNFGYVLTIIILLFHQTVTRIKQGYNKHWSVKFTNNNTSDSYTYQTRLQQALVSQILLILTHTQQIIRIQYIQFNTEIWLL